MPEYGIGPFSRQFAEHLLLGQSYDWKLIVFLQLMVKLEESGQVSLLRLSLLALGPVGFRRREINWGRVPRQKGDLAIPSLLFLLEQLACLSWGEKNSSPVIGQSSLILITLSSLAGRRKLGAILR